MSTSLPKTMKAIVVDGQSGSIKTNLRIPALEDGQILIKNAAVAGNPADWKFPAAGLAPQGSIMGYDAAGIIVTLGPKVDQTKFHVGDSVYGLINGCSFEHPENGAFAEYCALDSKLAFTASSGLELAGRDLDEGTVKHFESAASLPVSIFTAGGILHHHFGLRMDWEPQVTQIKSKILIWGGATALGQLLIQLIKKMNGFAKILVVASKRHEAQLKTYGADELYDYHDADVIERIKSKHDDIEYLVDAVSTPTTFRQTYQCAAETKNAVVLNVSNRLSINDIEQTSIKTNIKIDSTKLFLAFGKDIHFKGITIPQDLGYRKISVDLVEFLTPKINAGEIHHIPIQRFNGLEEVPALLDEIREGKNVGAKYVAVISS